MESTNQLFISSALKDVDLRDRLIVQINKDSPELTCVFMPEKRSWESAWKEECREKVRGCNGVIGIITANTIRADGQLWELRCAFETKRRVLLIGDDEACEMSTKKLPDLLRDEDILPWNDSNIAIFLGKLQR
ncbi:hypothetical protein [Nitrosomonas communis]|uniref:hypothetical protein n=1 Tax=Nitrosomonas communis TaxID=44574 RepID=UPI0026EB3AE7|nr:hypothetical protein [Nitrosomonas communis]MCO6428311.1 hypothetical protein [Nitrosomonas communis]